MKAEDLRIGNFVLDNLGGTLKIKGIQEDSDLSHIKPLILTEEWLVKFGYEKQCVTLSDGTQGGYWYKEDKMIRFAFWDGVWHCSMGDDKAGVLYKRLKYVHQFQNLCYELTDEKLTIKAEP